MDWACLLRQFQNAKNELQDATYMNCLDIDLHSEMDELCREEGELLVDLDGIQRVIRTIEMVISDYAEEE